MRPVFSAMVPKSASEPELMEDAKEARPYKGLFAVSDGASESYNSGVWARILVNRFVSQPKIDAEWISAAVDDYHARFNREAMSWSAQAAFDRGSFATLLGIQVAGDSVRLLAIGDSLAVIASGATFVDSFPYQSAAQFEERPHLLSTAHERNAALLRPAALRERTKLWRLRGVPSTRILLMTDAVGAWLLARPEARLPRLLALKSKREFGALIEAERTHGRMRRDDSTLLRLE